MGDIACTGGISLSVAYTIRGHIHPYPTYLIPLPVFPFIHLALLFVTANIPEMPNIRHDNDCLSIICLHFSCFDKGSGKTQREEVKMSNTQINEYWT